MPDSNLPLLEDAARKLAPFLEGVIFVGGVTSGLLSTDEGAAQIRGTKDVDAIAEIITYADYIVFSERLRKAGFTENQGKDALSCRWHRGSLIHYPSDEMLFIRPPLERPELIKIFLLGARKECYHAGACRCLSTDLRKNLLP